MDIELAIDMLEMAPHLTTPSYSLVTVIFGASRSRAAQGRQVSVVGTVKSSPPMVADELRRQADQFIDLQDLAAEISRGHQARNTGRDETGRRSGLLRRLRREPIVETSN